MNGTEIAKWSERVQDLLVICEGHSPDPARVLDDLHRILETGPEPICGPVRPGLSRAALHGLLEAGAPESAALGLVRGCTYMLSRGREGMVIASMLTPNCERDYSFSADSEAVALVGALATCLQERLRERAQADRAAAYPARNRKSPSTALSRSPRRDV